MNREELLKKIAQKTKRTALFRKDPRYVNIMGFLIAKGLLRTNQNIKPKPNQRIVLKDALWAGREVEPRILEVLPAAIVRLPKYFIFEHKEHPDLMRVIELMKHHEIDGPNFEGIEFKKLRVWLDFPLKDKRTKSQNEKRAMKTFRFSPQAIQKLKALSQKLEVTETELLERMLLKA